MHKSAKIGQSALSALDLLVALAILSLLCGVGSLSASQITAPRACQHFSTEMSVELEHIARKAQLSGREHQVDFMSPDKITVFEKRGPSIDPTKIYALPANVQITGSSFGNLNQVNPHLLILRPDGTASPGEVRFTDTQKNSCRITQALRGARTLVCSPR